MLESMMSFMRDSDPRVVQPCRHTLRLQREGRCGILACLSSGTQQPIGSCVVFIHTFTVLSPKHSLKWQAAAKCILWVMKSFKLIVVIVAQLSMD